MALRWVVKSATPPPENRAEILLDVAYSQYKKGNYYGCIQECDRALKYYQHWRAYQLKACAYMDMTNFKEAYNNAIISIRLEPNAITNFLCYQIVAELNTTNNNE